MRAGICRHDRLRRACDECDLAEEIATLRADLARVEAERDEARARVAGLEAAMPSGADVALIRAVSSDLKADGRGGYRAANVIDAWLTRYAEALGGGK